MGVASRLPLAAIIALSLTTCRSPTAITITVVTDVDCADHPSSLVVVGSLHAIEQRPPSSSSSRCDSSVTPHRIGTLVIAPSAANDDEVAFKVLVGIGQSPESCVAPDYKGCIVARRALRFQPHASIDVTVPMLVSCKDVPCGETQTCVHGACASATCDGANASCGDQANLDGGVDGAVADSGAPSCPAGEGPPMVGVVAPGGSFCIDTTEVTNAEFNRFVASPGALHYPPECASVADAGLPPPVTDPGVAKRPATLLSFCDAWAYCAWAGKRLCGKIGGGRALGDVTTANEWVYACSNGTGTTYPYGSTYDPAACNSEGDAAAGTSLLTDVGSRSKCRGASGAFASIFDMSGNAQELDSYADTTAIDDAGTVLVQARGGNVSSGVDTKCGTRDELGQLTRASGFYVGFRCCADAR